MREAGLGPMQQIILRQGRLGLPDGQQLVGIERAELRVFRVFGQQSLGLADRIGIVKPLGQHIDIVKTRRQKVGVHLAALRQNKRRILIFAHPRAQFGQQAHRGRMAWRGQQKRADPRLGQLVILIVIGRKRRQKRARLPLDLAQSRPRLVGAPPIHPLAQQGQHLPRGRQHRVARHRPFIGGNRPGPLARRPAPMAHFLMRPAQMRLGIDQPAYQHARPRQILGHPRDHRADIQRLAIIARRRQRRQRQPLRARQIAPRKGRLGRIDRFLRHLCQLPARKIMP